MRPCCCGGVHELLGRRSLSLHGAGVEVSIPIIQGTSHRPVTGQICPLLAADRTSRIPGDLLRRSRNEKKNGRPFVRWPELRPDKSRPSVPRLKRNGRSGPSGAPSSRSSLQAVGRRRRRPRAKIVAGRAPKSSQAARQNRRRPRAKRDAAKQHAAVNLPRPIASPQGPRRACTAGRSAAQRGGRAPPLLQCTAAPKYAAETKSAVYGSKWCDGPVAIVATARPT